MSFLIVIPFQVSSKVADFTKNNRVNIGQWMKGNFRSNRSVTSLNTYLRLQTKSEKTLPNNKGKCPLIEFSDIEKEVRLIPPYKVYYETWCTIYLQTLIATKFQEDTIGKI